MSDERPRPAYGDERPRPAYGEYATPEQQAAAMGKQYAPPPVGPAVLAPPPYGQVPATAPAQPGRWDVLLTFVLLAWGLFNVISDFIQFSNMPATFQRFYTTLGIGTFTEASRATKLGIVFDVANVVIYLVVLLGAYRQLRRARPAAYIPLLGGVLSFIIIITGVIVVCYGDPAFVAYMNKGA